MKTSSAKAKGRRLCQEVKSLLHETFPELEDADIVVTPSGTNGIDVQLSPLARKSFPYAVEAKNQESLSIWKALLQAASHKEPGLEPLLIFRRNHSKTYACLEIDAFLSLVSGKQVRNDGNNRSNKSRKNTKRTL